MKLMRYQEKKKEIAETDRGLFPLGSSGSHFTIQSETQWTAQCGCNLQLGQRPFQGAACSVVWGWREKRPPLADYVFFSIPLPRNQPIT